MSTHSPRRGSTILMVIIFIIALSIITGSVISLNLFEQQRIVDKDMQIKARYAAEAVLENAAAQIRQAFQRRTRVDQTWINNSTIPTNLPTSLFPASTGITLNGLTIRAGTRGASVLINDATDAMNGRNVTPQAIRLYASATATDPRSGRTHTAYAAQVVTVRDAPPTSSAIHYLPDCEAAPGDLMDIYGPAYCDRNFWLQSAKGLVFHSSLRAKGGLYYGRKLTGKADANGDVQIRDGGSDKYFSLKHEYNLTDPDTDTPYTSTRWIDSRTTDIDFNENKVIDAFEDESDWMTTSGNTWNGNVRTDVGDTSDMNPFGFAPYEPLNYASPVYADQDRINQAYDLIRPALETDNSIYPKDPGNKLAPGETGYEAQEEQRELRNAELSKFELKAGLVIKVTSTSPLTVQGYKWVEDTSAGTYERATESADPAAAEYSTYRLEEVTIPSAVFSTATMRDYRRGANITVVNVDMSRLNTLIRTPGATAATKIQGFDVDSDWNGVVYVQQSNTTNTGIRLINGATLPSRGKAFDEGHGLTVATNSPLYIKGNYNADGANLTGEKIRDSDDGEVPAALVSDSITFLSSSWSDSYTSSTALGSRKATNTEVAAAIMTGVVPTDRYNSYSGGVENLPRFLEDWSGGKVFGYRGSMLVFFESEIATQKWPGTGTVYNPPVRTWGYAQSFQNGEVVPGFPYFRTFRRTFQQDITKAAYDAAIAASP